MELHFHFYLFRILLHCDVQQFLPLASSRQSQTVLLLSSTTTTCLTLQLFPPARSQLTAIFIVFALSCVLREQDGKPREVPAAW